MNRLPAGPAPSLPALSLLDAWIGEKTGLGKELTPRSLRDWQLARLKETLAYVKNRSPFYRQALAHIPLEKIRELEDPAELPLTSAQDLRYAGSAFVCVSAKEIDRIMSLGTSGTDGPPKRLYFSPKDQELSVNFFSVGIRTMADPGDTVFIYLGPSTPGNTVDLLCKGLERSAIKAVVRDMSEDPCRPLSGPEAAACGCFMGMPVRMLQMAKANPGLRPKSVILCADYAPSVCGPAIKALWGSKVFTHYGSTESGLGGAVSCADGGELHLRAADLLFEIVDPKTGLRVPDGEWGEIVFTTLSREAMPLIRYRTGDISRMLTAPCACGSSLPRLAPIQGRYTNSISLPSGSSLSIHQLDELLFSIPEVLDYTAELLPEPLLRITLRTDAASASAGLTGRVRGLLEPGLPIEVTLVHEALPPASGKRRLSAR